MPWSTANEEIHVAQVISRVKRTLRHMSRFRFFDSERFRIPANLPLDEGEIPIGAYLNNPPSLDRSFVVTNTSLLVEADGPWSPIHYSSIAKVQTPAAKTDVDGLNLLLRDGSTLYIPIHGGTERTSDAFEVMRFLNRILEDRLKYG